MEPFFIDKFINVLSSFLDGMKQATDVIRLNVYRRMGYRDIPSITPSEKIDAHSKYPFRQYSRCIEYCSVLYRLNYIGICYHGRQVGYVKSKSCGETTVYKSY